MDVPSQVKKTSEILENQYKLLDVVFQGWNDLASLKNSSLKLNGIIKRIGKEGNIADVGMDHAFQEISNNDLMWVDLFLKHAHPNRNGHLIMTDVFARFKRM